MSMSALVRSSNHDIEVTTYMIAAVLLNSQEYEAKGMPTREGMRSR